MHMMAVVDLEGNAVHPSVLPDVHDGICSTVHLLLSRSKIWMERIREE